MQLHLDQQKGIIDLTYMKLVSQGSQDYEKTVTRQFIELIPEHLHILKTNFDYGAYELVRKEMHRMIATLYIMGLNLKLKNEIEAIVGHNLNRAQLKAHLEVVKATCNEAKLEAQALLLTFS